MTMKKILKNIPKYLFREKDFRLGCLEITDQLKKAINKPVIKK